MRKLCNDAMTYLIVTLGWLKTKVYFGIIFTRWTHRTQSWALVKKTIFRSVFAVLQNLFRFFKMSFLSHESSWFSKMIRMSLRNHLAINQYFYISPTLFLRFEAARIRYFHLWYLKYRQLRPWRFALKPLTLWKLRNELLLWLRDRSKILKMMLHKRPLLQAYSQGHTSVIHPINRQRQTTKNSHCTAHLRQL